MMTMVVIDFDIWMEYNSRSWKSSRVIARVNGYHDVDVQNFPSHDLIISGQFPSPKLNIDV